MTVQLDPCFSGARRGELLQERGQVPRKRLATDSDQKGVIRVPSFVNLLSLSPWRNGCLVPQSLHQRTAIRSLSPCPRVPFFQITQLNLHVTMSIAAYIG